MATARTRGAHRAVAALLTVLLAVAALAQDASLDALVERIESAEKVRDRVRAVREVGSLAIGEEAARAVLVATAEATAHPAPVRLEAITQLIRRGHERSRAANAAVDLLAHHDAGVRAEAAERLGRLGKHAAPAAEKLMEAAGDDDETVRSLAVVALGELELPRGATRTAVWTLLNRVADDRNEVPDVRRFARESLDRMGTETGRAPVAPAKEESGSDAQWKTLRRKGNALVEKGRLEEGAMILRQALDACERAEGESATLRILNDLASAEHRMEHWDECERIRREALRIAEEHYGPRHEETAWTLNNLADILAKRDRLAEAESFARHALLIFEELGIHDTPNCALAVHNLGGICQDQGLYDEAETMIRRALASWRNAHGEGHSDVGRAYNSLASLYRAQERYDKAVTYYEKARDNWRESKGPDHLYTQYTYYNIGLTENGRGRYAAAERVLGECLPITERTLGKRSAMYVDTLSQYIRALRGLGRDRDADRLAAEEKRLRSELR